VETDKKLELDSPNLLVEYREAVDRAIKKAVRDALLKHKQANNPVAVWRDGKIVLLSGDEITITNEDDTL
jgi:hypothetical protein